MKVRGASAKRIVRLGVVLGISFWTEGASFPDAVDDVPAPANDIAELSVELDAAQIELRVRYAHPLDSLDSNYGAVFIDSDRDPDTPTDPFQFGADGQILFLLMDGYASGKVLANGQSTDLGNSGTAVAAAADGIVFTLPLALVGNSPHFRLFATSSHWPEGSRYDRAPDAGWWDTQSGLVVVPRPGDERVDCVYDDPAGDATVPDLTRIEQRVRNGNVEFWFTFSHGVEYADLPAGAAMLDLVVRMDLDHRLWSGYRNDNEWPPSFGIERTLEVTFGRLFTPALAHLECVRPGASANPFDALLPDLDKPGIGSLYNDTRLIVGEDAQFGTARNQIFVSLPLAFLGYDDGEMLLRAAALRVGSEQTDSTDLLPSQGALDTCVGLVGDMRVKALVACAGPESVHEDDDADSLGSGVQGDELRAIRGCATADGGLRLMVELESLEPSDLGFVNVFIDTDGNAATGLPLCNNSANAIGVDCQLNFKIAATPTPSLVMATLTEFRNPPLAAGVHNIAQLVTPLMGEALAGSGVKPGYSVTLPAEILQAPAGGTIRLFALTALQFYEYDPADDPDLSGADIGKFNPQGNSQPVDWAPESGFFEVAGPQTQPALTLLSVVPNRGPVDGGTEVRVYGSAFPRNAVVRFGAVDVETQFIAPGELRAQSPAHALGKVDVSVGAPGGAAVTRQQAFTFGPAEVLAPTVTGVEPSLGAVAGGTKITITGLNFQPGATVRVGAGWATQTNVQSAFKMTCVTPPGPLGAADVRVSNPDGKSAMLSEGYAYGSRPPEIWTLYPNFGSVNGGTPVTVIGDGFLSGATATLGGVPLENVTVVSDRMLHGTSGARLAGLVEVTVRNLNTLSRTKGAAFAYGSPDPGLPAPGPFHPPIPMNAAVNGGVWATAMVPGVRPGAAVLFDGYPALVREIEPTVPMVSALVPPHPSGLVRLELVNPDGKSVVLPALDVWHSFSYGYGPPGLMTVGFGLSDLDFPTTGGQVLGVLGSNFLPGTTVDFGGIKGEVLSGGAPFENYLEVLVPPHPPGEVTLTFTNPDGQSVVYVPNWPLKPPFRYVGDEPSAPVLSQVKPAEGSQFGGDTVTLTGQSLVRGIQVFFDRVEASNVVWSSTTSLTCVTPPHARGAVEVTVVNLDNQSRTVANAFTYLAPPPVVTTLAPTNTGPTSGGTDLYIGGSGFLPESQVFIGGSRALPTRYINATTLWVATPPGFPGKADVTVVNPGNRVGTKAQAYTYVGDKAPPPQVAVVSPDRGPVAGGTPITVSGQNFLPGVKVWVGGKEATPVTLHSPIALSAVTPSGTAGVTNVIVANKDGHSSTNATGFAYVSTDPPSIQQPPVDQVAMVGETAMFSAQAAGAAPLAYQWLRNGQALTDGAHYSGTHTNTLTILDLTTNLAGVYRLEVSNAFGQVESAPARLEVLRNQPLPGVWATRDVGSVGTAGQVAFDAGALVIEADGTNIAATADAFRFVCQPMVGDGEIRARIARLDPTHPEALAGVMMREDLSPKSAHAFVGVTAGRGSALLSRSRYGITTASVAPADGVTAPRWVNLRRHGEWLAGYGSTDGVQWTLVGAARVPMTDAVQVGLAVSSHVADVLTTAVFEQVEVMAGTPALTGGLEREGWNTRNELDHSIAGWQTNPQYGGPPVLLDVIPQIEVSLTPPGVHWNLYGERLSGYVVPPVTGEYVFYLAADNEAELWLSPNEDPAQNQKIVEVTATTAFRAWPQHPSAPIQLEANRPYAVEVLHLQHWEGSHLGVTWKLPNAAAPAAGADPIGGAHLAWRLAGSSAPALRSAPAGQSRFFGAQATFTVHAEGAPPLQYRWQKDGVEVTDGERIRGADTACLTVQDLRASDAGDYRVTVSNAQGELHAGPARLTVIPPPNTPALTQSRDFLTGGEPGVSSYADGVYTIQGSSRFVYAPLTGDGGIVARLTSFDDAKTQYSAGLGVLEKLDPASAILSLLLSGSEDVVWSYRPAGGSSTTLFGGEGRVPCWLQVTRQGPWFTARKSLDGVTWDLVNRCTNSLPLTVQMGLAVGTGAVTNLTRATFDSVQLGSLAESTLGGLLREAWAEGGYNISDLVSNPKYPHAPASQSIITQSLTDDVPPATVWNSYGQRLSGYLIPPVTGDYVFYLGGDNAAQLWLSGTTDPAGKQLIAEVTTATAYLDWNSTNGPTRSNPIHMEAGQWRYVEVLHVQQWESSWVGVNWKRPDTDMPVIGDRGIPGRYLAYAIPGHDAPVIVQQPSDAARGVADTVTFGVLASGTPPLSYQWRKGNTDLADDARFAGTKTRELTIANLQVSDSGYYSVVVTNVFGQTNSVAAGLDVKSCEPAPPGLAGWWPGDGNPDDLVGAAHGTNQGGVLYTVAQVGQGFTFDSNDDRVVIPHRAAFNPAKPGFTVQFWMKGGKDQPEWIAALVEKSHGGDGTGWAVQVARGDGTIRWAVFGASAEITAGVDSLNDQWHHVAGVWDGANTLRLYVDAIRCGAANLTSPSNNTRPLNVGFWWSGGRGFRGQIDELAIHDRALSETEITAVYLMGSAGMCNTLPPTLFAQPRDVTRGPGGTATFSVQAGGTAPLTYRWAKDGLALVDDTQVAGAYTATLTLSNVTAADAGRYTVTVTNPHGAAVSDPATLAIATECFPPPASLVGWWPGDGSAQDSVGGNHATNTTGVSHTAGRVDQSFVFDNNNDRLIVPHREAYNPTLPGFAVQFWMKGTKAQPGGSCTLVEKSHGWVDNTGWAVQVSAGNGIIAINIGNGSGFPGVGSSVDVLDDRWHHYAATWDGATIRHYVDAVPQGTAALAAPVNNPRPLNLGFTWGGGNPQRFFRGQIDELAIHDRALSAEEVALLHALGAQGAGLCKAPTIIQPPVDQIVTAGDAATFSVIASGGLPLTYQWSKENVVLTDSAHVLGSTSPTLTVPSAQPSDAGGYSVQVGNARGSVSAGPARLTVNPASGGGDWMWGQQSTSLNDWTEAWAATTDATGNVYVSGTFKGVVNFGAYRLTALAPSDFFLAKYSPGGTVQWARQGGVTDTCFTNLIATAAYGVAVDSSGNTFVAGSFAGTNFPFGVYAVTSAGDADIFLAKYDPNGMLSHTWTARAGGTGWDAAQALAIDGDDNLYLTGQLGSDTADFGANVARRAGGADVFVAKYNSAGANLWVRTAGGPRHDMGYGIAADASGNSYLAGYFQGRARFGDQTVTAAGLSDVFLAKYNSDGTCEWVRSAGGAANESAFAVTLVGVDQLGLTGYLQGAATFGTTSLPSPGAGHTDLFVAQYDRSGSLLWARTAGGTNVYGRALATDQIGRLCVTGILGGTAEFSGHPLSNSEAVDLFLAAYDTTGDVAWNRAGGQPYAYANGLACDAAGNLIAVGAFSGRAQFGPDLLTQPNGLAAVVAKAGATGGGGTGGCAAPPGGLLGWWPGDGSASDLAGANSGTLLNGATYAAGNVGQAFRFDGVDDAVDLGTKLVLGPAFTEMAWILSQAQDDIEHGFLGHEPAGGNKQRAPSLSVYQRNRLRAGFGDGSNWNELTTDPLLKLDAWNHVAATFDRTNYVAYINGVAVLSTNACQGRVPCATPLRYIGRVNDCFAGLVDEIAVFNRALNATEIGAIHAAGHDGMCADLPPVILAHPIDQAKDEGATAAFLVMARGSEPLTYQWWKGDSALTNDARVSGAQAASLGLANLQAADAASYRVVVRNARGTAESQPAWLQVRSPNCTPQPSGLLAWWPAEANAEDASGSGHAGALSGNAGYAAGRVGQAFSFNGGVDGVLLAQNALNSSLAALTIEGWVWPDELGHLDSGGYRHGRTLFSTTQDAGYALRVMDGWLEADLWLTGGRVALLLTNTLPVPLRARAWAHVALAYDGAQVRGYVNGSLVGIAAASGTIIAPSTARTVIGNEANATGVEGGDWGWRGRIDEWSVYNRALTAAEVSAIASAGAGKCRGDLPAIVAQPESVTTHAGAAVTFSVQASSAGPMTAQWLKDRQPLRGATSLALSLASVAPSDAGGYALALANSYGAVTSRVAQLTVLMVEPPQPPQITRQPVGGTNNVGATVTLSVQASGTPPLAYQWRKDNMDLPAATSPTLTLSSLRLGDAGEYNVRVSNTAGARFSGSARVVVNAPLPSARPEWLWAFQPGPSNNGFVFGLSCDTAQNVWMGGAVRGTAVFGDKTIRCDVGQESSMTVAQLNPAGTPLQALRLGGGGDGGAGTVLVQDSGDLLVVGSVDGDAMLLRLDSTGRALWSRPWTSATNSSTVAVDLATAADGSTYFNAMLLGTVKIGTSTIVSRGDADAILAKYDRAGEVVWLRQIGGRGTDQPFGPGVNAAGAVYTAGSFTMSLPLGPTNLVSRGSDAFLLKYDAAGTLLWARSGGGTDDELVTGFALTPQDHVYLAGAFLGTAEFGRISLPSLGGSDLFLVKYDAAGAVLWAKSVGSAIGDGEPVVGADTAGNAYLAGVSRGERLVLGGTTLTNTTGGGLVFVAKFDPNGGLQWVQSGAAVSDAALTDLLVDAAGNVYTSGYYDGVLGLGKLAIANQTQGLFIAKLGFAPVILSPPPALVTTNASAPVTLAVAAAGAEPLTYTWTKDGTTIPGATGPNLLLAGLPAGSVGVYRVTVSNPYGTTPTAESRVEVISGGLANVRAAQRPGTTFVDITYNLGGTAPVAVTVAASSDGGKTWTVPVRTVAGDVGASIQPGADRRIVWSAGTDWLNHQTAGFMVRVSIPGMQVTTPPLTVNTMQAGAWRLRVWADLNGNGTYDENVEGRNEALAGAEVYYGGRTEAHLLPGRTEADGTVAVAKAASAGEVVFARHRLEEVQAKKPFHDAVGKLMSTLWLDSDRGGTDTSNWDGQWLSRTLSSSEVTAAQAGQIVPVRVAHPVFEWHLVAALEPADAALAKRVMLGLAQASAYFYNVTDGQMKFGQVAIYTGVSTNAALWHNADLILFAENEYRANAALNGVRSAQPGWQMRFGATSRQSFPDEPMYFSSFVHEFGHYALGFLDEYLDGNGAFEPWEEYRKQHPDKVPSNYGLMDRDYLLPELSSFNDYLDRYPAPLAPATVSDHLYYFWKKSGFLLPCWQLFELAWERPYTGVPVEIVSPPPGHYDGYDQHSSNDRLKPDRVPAPYVYLQVSFEDPAGPTRSVVRSLSDIPRLATGGGGTGVADITVAGPQGPVAGVSAVVRKHGGASLERLGQTDAQGRLRAFGLAPDDTVTLHSDGAVTRQTVVRAAPGEAVRLAFNAPERRDRGAVGLHSGPGSALAMVVRGTLTETPTRTLQMVFEFTQPLADPPEATLWLDDRDPQPLVINGLGNNRYGGQFALGAARRGTLELHAQALDGQTLDTSDVFQWAAVSAEGDQVFSRDGRVELNFLPGSLPSDGSLAVLQNWGPVPLPPGDTVQRVGAAFVVTLADPGLVFGADLALNWYYQDAEVAGSDERSLRLHRWDKAASRWLVVEARVAVDANVVSARLAGSGTYAVFASPSSDTTAPSGVTDLTASTGMANRSVELAWTAPGDDGLAGAATSYLLKAATNAITLLNWDVLPAYPMPLAPPAGGASCQITLELPRGGVSYWFALRAQDEAGNLGPLSNVALARSQQDDADGDGLPDDWESSRGLNPFDPTDADRDDDGDGLVNRREFDAATDPNSWDTDGDGLNDRWEIEAGLDPTSASDPTEDTDGDGLSNTAEYRNSTDPNRPDTDRDGLPDAWEVAYGLCPFSASGDNGADGDPDRDGRGNLDEYLAGTDPVVSVRPEFGPCELLSDGRLRLTVVGQVGRHYEVQVSTDLAQWTPWTDFVSTSESTVLHDTPLPSPSVRFYRLVQRGTGSAAVPHH